jgi:hypothetical protein
MPINFSKAFSLSSTSEGIFLAFLSLACCFVPGCDYFYYDETRDNPPLEALVGTWVPDSSSLKYIREEGGYSVSTRTELLLKADGKYEMNNMPDWFWFHDGVSRKTFRSEVGTWEVSPDAGRPYWTLRLRAHDSERGIGLHGQRAPYRLRFRFGHIDENKYMIFVKEQ